MTPQEAQIHLTRLLKAVEKAVDTYDELVELRKSFNCIKTELLKDEKTTGTTSNPNN